jgi:trimethylamine---corrinoid protein Co-methyltransferase
MNLDQAALDKIHSHSLEILRDVGIRFPCEKALALFRGHGFKVDGSMVRFEEEDIQHALETVPAAFTIEARNLSRSIEIGDANYAMAPGYGPPFIIEPSGEKRAATLADVQQFCRLVQTSKYLDFNSSVVVQPGDVPTETAHLDILLP